LPNRGIVVDVLRHHLQHIGEVHQRDERRIEPLSLRSTRQLSVGQVGITRKPVGDIENLLRVRRRSRDLRQQGIRIQSNRRQELVQLLRIRRRILSPSLHGKLDYDQTEH